MNRVARYVSGILAALSIAVVAAPALADTAPANPPAVSPKKKAKSAKLVNVDVTFDQYLLTPRGEVNALLLNDGSVVRVPWGVTTKTSLTKGETIHLEAKAVSTSAGSVYLRPMVTHGTDTILDGTNPPKKEKGEKGDKTAKKSKLSKSTAKGKVDAFVIDGKGDHIGVVLDDGTVAYTRMHDDLVALGVNKGDTITIDGKGGSYALGKAMFIESVKLANGSTVTPKAWAKK